MSKGADVERSMESSALSMEDFVIEQRDLRQEPTAPRRHEEARWDAEVAAATQECQQLATELASRQLQAARLREELRGLRSSSQAHHTSETNKYFEGVQQAMNHN